MATESIPNAVALIYYVGPEWVMTLNRPDSPVASPGETTDAMLERGVRFGRTTEFSRHGYQSREDAETAAVGFAAERGVTALALHDLSGPPYRIVALPIPEKGGL